MTPRAIALLACALLPQASARLGQSRQPFLVKLWKEHARNINASANSSEEQEVPRDHGRGYFVGAIRLGSPEPQEMHVVFSTTTGMVSLPSSNCSSAACQEHHRYSPGNSETSIDVQRDGLPVDPAGGRRAPDGARRDTASLGFYTTNGVDTTGLEGNFVAERLCMGDRLGNAAKPDPVCAKVSMVVATTIQEATFRTRPQDGLVGLSLQGLSIAPQFNILNCLGAEGMQKQFGFWVEDDASNAELVFGGYDRERLASALSWVPVAEPEMGHWLVDIQGVSVGGQKLKMCQAPHFCRGLIDTSSPGITMPQALHPELAALIEPSKASSQGCSLPDLSLELRGGVTLTLRVEDYAGPRCEPEIRQHHFGEDIAGAQLWLLGEPVLRRYYTVFDWGKERLGFAMSNVERSCQRLSLAGLPTGPGDCQGPVEPLEDALVMLTEEQDVLHFRQEA